MLVFQRPLLDYALLFIELDIFQGWVQLASLQVLQFTLMFIALGLIGLLPMLLLKGFCILILFVNASAANFMTTYNTEIDQQ